MITITQFGALIKKTPENAGLVKKYEDAATLHQLSNFHKCTFAKALYTTFRDNLFFPRFLVEMDAPRRVKLPNAVEIDLNQVGALRPFQTEIVDEIMSSYFAPESAARGAAGVILKLDMGAGKSFIAMELIGRIRQKTLIVCHISNMVPQWKQNLEGWFQGVQVGELNGRVKKDGQIVVGLIQTLSKKTIKVGKVEQPAHEYFAQFGLIVFDEAHLYCSETYSKIFSNCQVRYMLGLSGTPYNKDDSHQVILGNIGPVFDAEHLVPQVSKFEAEVRVVQFRATRDYTEPVLKKDRVDYQRTIDRILANPERLAAVVFHIKEVAQTRNVFVFSDRRDYLEKIQDALSADGNAMSIVAGGSNEAALEEAVLSARIIGTTYQYMSTGRSISKMNGLVFATPRKVKIEQTLGRIFRSGSSMEKRIIVDLVDMGTILVSQYRARKSIYEERGYERVAV